MARWTFAVYRRSETIASGEVEATVAPSPAYGPEEGAHVEVVLRGTADLTGSVLVEGELDGSPVSETLTFTGPVSSEFAVEQTLGRFHFVTDLTFTGLDDESPVPTYTARFVGATGEPFPSSQQLVERLRCHRETLGQAGSWPAQQSGTHETRKVVIMFDRHPGYTPRPGDVLVEVGPTGDQTGSQWEIVGRPDWFGHHELVAEQRDHVDVTVRTA